MENRNPRFSPVENPFSIHKLINPAAPLQQLSFAHL